MNTTAILLPGTTVLSPVGGSGPTAITDDGGQPAGNGAVRYKLLTQTHRLYDRKLLQELTDLYEGGYTIQRKAKTYLPQLVNETSPRHDERIACAGYQGFLGQVVNQFSTDLFGQQLQMTVAKNADDKAAAKDDDAPPAGKAKKSKRAKPIAPTEPPDRKFYTEFAENADLRGHPFADVMRDALTTALYKPWGLVQVDAKAPDPNAPPPVTVADEEAQGLKRLYAYELPPEQLTNWKRDAQGGFVWAVVHQIEKGQEEPFEPQGKTTETWTLWKMGEGGKAEWTRYRIRYDADKPPEPEALVPKDGEGTTQFLRIPILPLELPLGLQVGHILGPMQKEHWQRRSALIASQSASLMAVPVIQLGDQMSAQGGAIPADIAQDDSRGNDPKRQLESRGYMVLAADDKYGYLEPSGKCHEIVDKQLESLREAMLQISHQMALSVKPTAGTAQRSGVSKAKDGESTTKVLTALGHEVRMLAVATYTTISEARGEKGVHWQPHGLDTFENDSDREELVEEAVSLPQILAGIKSITARKLIVFMLVKRLLSGLDAETLDVIEDELDEGMTAEDEMNLEADAAEHDAKVANDKAAAVNPPAAKPATPPVAKPAKPPVPKAS